MTWLTVTEYLCHKWPSTCRVCRNHNSVLSLFVTFHRVCNKSNTTSATNGAGTGYLSGAPDFTPSFSGVRVARSLVFSVVFCRSLLVLCSFTVCHCVCFLLRFTDCDYHFRTLKFFFLMDRHDITEILLKVALNTINLYMPVWSLLKTMFFLYIYVD